MDDDSKELTGPLGDCGALASQDDEGHLGCEECPVTIVLSQLPGCSPAVSSGNDKVEVISLSPRLGFTGLT